MTDKLKINPKEVEETLKEAAKSPKELARYSEEELKNISGMGMKNVDPADIWPPSILLMQRSSNLDDFVDGEGTSPKVGQFFHTGKQKIMDKFEAYFLYFGKSTYVNKQSTDPSPKMQYVAIGALSPDLSLFGIKFRSTALYAASKLFTAVVAQKRPVFSFKVMLETKWVEGEEYKWVVPVIRIVGPENDVKILKELEAMARPLDQKIEKKAEIEGEAEEESPKDSIPF